MKQKFSLATINQDSLKSVFKNILKKLIHPKICKNCPINLQLYGRAIFENFGMNWFFHVRSLKKTDFTMWACTKIFRWKPFLWYYNFLCKMFYRIFFSRYVTRPSKCLLHIKLLSDWGTVIAFKVEFNYTFSDTIKNCVVSNTYVQLYIHISWNSYTQPKNLC